MVNKSRRRTPVVSIGPVLLGQDHPVVIQAMTDTPTANVDKTLRQTRELIESGAEMVRWTINDAAAAVSAVHMIRELRSNGLHTPIIGDFHYNGHILLSQHEELAEHLSKYRINPGNVGRGERKDENFARIIHFAVKYQKPVRIGANWGSVDQDLVAAAMDESLRDGNPFDSKEIMYRVIIDTVIASCRRAIELGLKEDQIVVSAKLSVVEDLIEVSRRLASVCDYVLHIGLTEAGAGVQGIAATSAAMSVLLDEGIGDTIRASLTPEPGMPRSREVEVCQQVLQALGLRKFCPSVTSCPGCGRTESSYFQELAEAVREYVKKRSPDWRRQCPGVEGLKIAVMGCVVNGPGESRHADIGISLPGAFEEPVAPVYIDGRKSATLQGAHLKEDFLDLLERYVQERYCRASTV